MVEHRDLQLKVDRLNLFIQQNPEYKQLDRVDQELFVRQLEHMRGYNGVLIERIKRFTPLV